MPYAIMAHSDCLFFSMLRTCVRGWRSPTFSPSICVCALFLHAIAMMRCAPWVLQWHQSRLLGRFCHQRLWRSHSSCLCSLLCTCKQCSCQHRSMSTLCSDQTLIGFVAFIQGGGLTRRMSQEELLPSFCKTPHAHSSEEHLLPIQGGS